MASSSSVQFKKFLFNQVDDIAGNEVSPTKQNKKSLPQSLFLQMKGHYEVPLKKKFQQNCLALMIITICIWFI